MIGAGTGTGTGGLYLLRTLKTFASSKLRGSAELDSCYVQLHFVSNSALHYVSVENESAYGLCI